MISNTKPDIIVGLFKYTLVKIKSQALSNFTIIDANKWEHKMGEYKQAEKQKQFP